MIHEIWICGTTNIRTVTIKYYDHLPEGMQWLAIVDCGVPLTPEDVHTHETLEDARIWHVDGFDTLYHFE